MAVLSGVVTTEYTELETKRSIIKRECTNVADAIRKIKIGDLKCRPELERMANDFMLNLNYAIYNLNTAIPSIITVETHKLLAGACLKVTEICNDLHQAKLEGCEELKEKLAVALDQLKTGVEWFENEFKIPNQFVCNQLKRKNHIFTFAIYKLKYEAAFFGGTNMELEAALDTGLVEFTRTVKSLTTTAKAAEDSLHRAFHNLAFITERAVDKLENWIGINQEHPDSVKCVRKVSMALSDLYSQLTRAANKDVQNVPHLKSQLVNIFEAETKEVSKLTEIRYADSLGGQEFIRSILFDIISFAGVYSENLKIVAAKP